MFCSVMFVYWIGSLTPFAFTVICDYRQYVPQNDGNRYQLKIPFSFKVKWDDRVIWISIKKTVRITLMFWKMWELGGSAIVITFLFYPAASCPYHRYWVDNGCGVCGVLPSTVFMEFSGVAFKIIDLSINKENRWQSWLDCPCFPSICHLLG